MGFLGNDSRSFTAIGPPFDDGINVPVVSFSLPRWTLPFLPASLLLAPALALSYNFYLPTFDTINFKSRDRFCLLL